MVLREIFPMSKGQLGRQVHLLLVMLLPVRDGHTLNEQQQTYTRCMLAVTGSNWHMKYTDKQTNLMSHPFR